MSNAELAALITACGVSIAGIITAIAALRNANYSAAKVRDLETQIETLREENESLRAENETLRRDVQHEREHSRMQDEIIFNQQVKIGKWQRWGQEIGRAFNIMQLEYGAVAKQQDADKKQTGPLPELPE